MTAIDEPEDAHRAQRLRRAIESHLGSRDVARVIYGSIIGLALVVALQAHPPGAGTAASLLVGTAIAVGLEFFVLAALGAFDIDVAFQLAKWTGLGLICVYAFVAARLSGYHLLGALVHAALIGAVGGALIALNPLLH